MRYAKLINGAIYYAPNPILHNGLMRYNPPGSVYEAEGYKPVRYTDPPTPEPGYTVVPSWVETAEEIVQMWTEEEELNPDENRLLPVVDASDNGSILRVVNGSWAAAELPTAESEAY